MFALAKGQEVAVAMYLLGALAPQPLKLPSKKPLEENTARRWIQSPVKSNRFVLNGGEAQVLFPEHLGD